ncbi:hypothetical protein GCM10023082_63510 [Streptomyces tremellae]|uniref:Uncharacterized protein n=1 Tax=Streptomyces tremellae TaxID=1124239 RepID=A0ABP7GDV5_9ACTN
MRLVAVLDALHGAIGVKDPLHSGERILRGDGMTSFGSVRSAGCNRGPVKADVTRGMLHSGAPASPDRLLHDVGARGLQEPTGLLRT